MPKLTNSLPKYRKKTVRKSVYAVVTLDGKDHYLGDYGSEASKKEFQRLTGEWQANGRRLPVEIGQDISVTELVAEYWRFAKTYYVKNGKPTDEQAGVRAATRHLLTQYGESLAKNFGPLSLESVRKQMIASGNSRKYINQNISRIKRMFKWAVSKQLIPVDTYRSLETLSGLKQEKCDAIETDPIMPVEIEVLRATVRHCPQVVADMIRLQVLIGCRPGELFSMKPSEIDRSGDVWRYRPGSHKMEHRGRHRLIFIGPKGQAILKPYLLRDSNSLCFHRPGGEAFKRWNYSDAINRACDLAFPAPNDTRGEALIKWQREHRWAPNRLRHTRGTEIRSSHGLEAAQVVLGHSRADVTQIYAERDEAKAAEIMREVG